MLKRGRLDIRGLDVSDLVVGNQDARKIGEREGESSLEDVTATVRVQR